jgi:hypothetical protein
VTKTVETVPSEASGIDTISYAWRPSDTAALDSFRRRPHCATRGQGYVLDQRGPGGERLLMFPRTGVMALEGRLGAMLDQDVKCMSLVSKALVEQGERCARSAVDGLLRVPLRGPAEVRRYDLTSEVSFDDPSRGRAFLRTMAGMCPPGMKVDTWSERGNSGAIETVYYRTPVRGEVRFRAYDKGVESGTEDAGTRIRLEAQMRPDKMQRRSPEQLADADLRRDFGRALAPYLDAGGDVVAAGSDGAVSHLLQKVVNGDLTMARAERLAGSIAILGAYGRGVYDSDRAGRRRLAALRDAGVSLEDTLPREAVVPVGQLLREAVAEFAA